jgi:predicted  nucleic acid-binding Zn-ribbon protein
MNKRELSKVFSKLSREEVNLESHKVELARKAPSVLKDFEKLDAKLRKSQDKVDSSFNSYRKSWQNFQSEVKDIEADRKRLEGDVAEINQSAMDLGVDFNDVKGLKESQDLSRKLDGLTKDLPKLYSEPK